MASDNLKRVVILHGWTDGDISDFSEFLPNSEQNWMGWIKKELEKRGYHVDAPFLQHGYKSEYAYWKSEIEKLTIDRNTILVGWSSGGAFWVRWLSENKVRVKKLILVAPAKVTGNTERSLREIQALDINPEWRAQWEQFHDFQCDTEIKKRIEKITILISNDALWLIESANIYADELDAKLIKIENQGHFENHHRPAPEFSELLSAILK